MPLRIRNAYRKVPSRLRKSPSQQRGWLRSINIFTTVMNSNVPSAVPPTLGSRKVTSSRPLEIDVDRPAERIEKISQACLFVPRDPANGNGASLRWKSLPRPFPHAHTSAKMRAQTWPSTYRIRFFVWHYWGVALNMARECGGERSSADRKNVEANVSQEFKDFEGFPDRAFVFWLYIFFVPNNFINLPSYIEKTYMYICMTKRNPQTI